MNPFQTLSRRISSEKFDARLGRLASFVTAILLLALGMMRVTSLRLTEAELFFGMLLVLAVAMQAIIIGILLGIQADRS